MSFAIFRLTILIFLPALPFLYGAAVQAQDMEAVLKVSADGRVQVAGKFLRPRYAADKNWTFLQSYADVGDLGKRIDKLRLFDAGGAAVAVKQFAPGIYDGETGAAGWSYEVNAELRPDATAAAHVSWLTAGGGLLMPEDLLPHINKSEGERISARITLELPAGWQAYGPDFSKGAFTVNNIAKVVIPVGRDWREKSAQLGPNQLNFVTRGEWQFSDDEALSMALGILQEHQKTFGAMPFPKMQVVLSPFPQQVEPGRWRAETRGANAVLISSKMPFESQALNRLHEQLRHEMFHYWVPNRLSLTGNYDWFFEGFTIYQALKTGKLTGRIRFSDFLGTLSQAYAAGNSAGGPDGDVSLIEATRKRWAGNFSFVNSRGVMAAFLCDMALIRASKGKRSLTGIFRELYEKHNDLKSPVDGTRAVLALLKSHPELTEITARYIEGGDRLEIAAPLLEFGLELHKSAGVTRLKIVPEPNGRQKNLLIRLGLNPLYELPEKPKSR